MHEEVIESRIELLSKKLQREQEARREAENILENLSSELYFANLYLTERYEVSRILAESRLLEEAMPSILEIICTTLQMKVGSFWKLDETNQVLRNVCNWNDEKFKGTTLFVEETKKYNFVIGQGVPGRVWKNKSVCFIPDVVKDDNFPRVKLAQKAGLHSAFGIPILFEGEVTAVLDFFTNETYTSNEPKSKFLHDVGRQIGIFIAREEVENRIKTLSRRAGMAEAASSVLHNIGNILNSIKVSLEMVREILEKSNIEHFIRVTKLLNEHLDDITTYLSQDPKGKILPHYLIELAKPIEADQNKMLQECLDLAMHTKHIEEIVAAQQSISGIAGIIEKFSVSELIDTAIDMCNTPISTQIPIQKEYDDYLFITSDKSKLIQILVNLIQNAQESLIDPDCMASHKKILIRVEKKYSNNIELLKITVEDNGVGIQKDNIIKIFSFGFSTKLNGHGFGLHSSALSAMELGGSLEAESEGKGYGAKFILTLPMMHHHKKTRFIHVK